MSFENVEKYVRGLSLPGCCVTAFQNHRRLYSFSAGELGPDARCFMYSCTKPVTVTAALRLLERGEIALDAPVAEYLPAYKRAYTLEDGERVAREITVRHLFTMSAGLSYNLTAKPILDAMSAGLDDTVSIANSFIESPLSFAPGDRFQYSLCHDVLGAVIEVVSGKTLADFMRDEIFEPLDMRDTSFTYSPSQLAPQYRLEAGKLTPIDGTNCFIFSNKYFSGGAGLISTLEDYAKFADAMASGGTNGYRLLSDDTVNLMRKDQLRGFLREPAFGCAAGPGYGYGLGVRTLIDKSGGQRSPLGEFGWDGAAGSYILIDRDNAISIAFTTHVLGWSSLGAIHAPIRDLTYEALGF